MKIQEQAAPIPGLSRWTLTLPFFFCILAADAAVLAVSPHRNASFLGSLPGSFIPFVLWGVAIGTFAELLLAATLHVASKVIGGRASFHQFGPPHVSVTAAALALAILAPWVSWFYPLAFILWAALSFWVIGETHRLSPARSLYAWIISLPMQVSALFLLLLVVQQALAYPRLAWDAQLAQAHHEALVGKMAETEQSLLKALQLSSAYNAHSADTGRISYELGVFYDSLGHKDDAVSYYQRAEPLLLQNYGITSRPYWDCIVRQAEMAEREGHLDEAEQRYSSLLKAMDSERGANHPFSIGYLNALGRLAYAQGHFDQAESYYTQALAVADSVPRSTPTNSNDFRVTLVNALAYTYAAEGKASDLQTLLSAHPGFEPALFYQTALWTQWTAAAEKAKAPTQVAMLLKRCIIVAKVMPPGDAHLQITQQAIAKFNRSHGNAAR